MSDIVKSIVPEHLRAVMRKVRALPPPVKNAVYKGCTDPRATIQFNEDLKLYGLWEALLYVEGYEEENNGYSEGTAKAAAEAAVEYFKS